MMKRFQIKKRDCKEEELETAGGKARQWVWRDGLSARIMGRYLKVKGVFCDTPVPLLGRTDFFAAFKVTFDEQSQSFTVEAY